MVLLSGADRVGGDDRPGAEITNVPKELVLVPAMDPGVHPPRVTHAAISSRLSRSGCRWVADPAMCLGHSGRIGQPSTDFALFSSTLLKRTLLCGQIGHGYVSLLISHLWVSSSGTSVALRQVLGRFSKTGGIKSH